MGRGFYQQTLLWQIKRVKENIVSSTPFLFYVALSEARAAIIGMPYN